MNLTPEIRAALLMGTCEGALCFPDASAAPKWAADRIVEIRHAIIEKRNVPAPSKEYLRACEQRALLDFAKAAGRKVLPEPTVAPVRKPEVRRRETLEQLSKRYGIPVAELEAAELRIRANKLGAEIAAYNLPTGPMTADERESMKRRLDVAAGLREPERFPWEL